HTHAEVFTSIYKTSLLKLTPSNSFFLCVHTQIATPSQDKSLWKAHTHTHTHRHRDTHTHTHTPVQNPACIYTSFAEGNAVELGEKMERREEWSGRGG